MAFYYHANYRGQRKCLATPYGEAVTFQTHLEIKMVNLTTSGAKKSLALYSEWHSAPLIGR